MPTGYTADVATGKIDAFADFAMLCARAFGATITMRDDPMDAPIPEAFEPSSYHAEALARETANLTRLKSMAPSEMIEARDAAEAKRQATFDKRNREKAEQRQRYADMLEKARAWKPPSPDHAALQDFMIKQLAESIDFDCAPSGFASDPLPEAQAWHKDQVRHVLWLIEYHAKEHSAEIERARSRTEWISLLRQSLTAEADQ